MAGFDSSQKQEPVTSQRLLFLARDDSQLNVRRHGNFVIVHEYVRPTSEKGLPTLGKIDTGRCLTQGFVQGRFLIFSLGIVT